MVVGISGLNNTDNPAPGVGVAKSIKRGNKLIGLSYDVNEPGIYQDNLFDEVYLMPYPTLGYDELENKLKELKRKTNIEAIIPTLDAELPLYIKYQKKIEELGIKLYLPELSSFEMRDKSKLLEFSKKIGTKYPETRTVMSLDALIKETKEMGFPLMVKGKYYKAYKAYNLDEAISYYYQISNEWGFPILLQKIVNGIEINYIGLGNGKELVGGIGIKKTMVTNLGKIWSGITIKNDKLIEIAKKFVKETNWKGPFEIEAISNGNDVYLIEINPRFPAWVYFSTMLGINLPKMMLNLIEGKRVKKRLTYPINKIYMRYVEETLVNCNELNTLLTKKSIRRK